MDSLVIRDCYFNDRVLWDLDTLEVRKHTDEVGAYSVLDGKYGCVKVCSHPREYTILDIHIRNYATAIKVDNQTFFAGSFYMCNYAFKTSGVLVVRFKSVQCVDWCSVAVDIDSHKLLCGWLKSFDYCIGDKTLAVKIDTLNRW